MDESVFKKEKHNDRKDEWPTLSNPYVPTDKEKKLFDNWNVLSPEKNQTLLGMVIFYIDVGQLPPFKAEAMVERMKDNLKNSRLHENYEVLFVPRRCVPSAVEYIPFNRS